jgi:hypothetical protein
MITEEIDGIEVVLGLDTEKLDQIATMKKIKPLVENSTEYKAKTVRLNKIKERTIANESLYKQGRKIANRVALQTGKVIGELVTSDFSSGENESLANYNAKISDNNEVINSANTELIDLEKNLKKKIAEIQKSDGVFFNLKNDYENTITDEKHAEFSEKLKQIKGKKMFLCSDGSIIVDNRNKKFFGLVDNVWTKKEIKALGEDVDTGIFKLYEDLLPEEIEVMNIQFESDRLKDLTPEELEAEKASQIEGAMYKATQEKNKLEIMGDADALVKSQELYNSLVAEIESKYSLN